ncbi:MAG: hypothetical protein J6A61_03580 [Clostridia bacterium]|nr:hypothetical protein [Clostridia bacterium]
MKRLLFIFSILSALLLTGCKIQQQEYNRFKVGEIYQTEVDAYVVFGYATFIWQDPKDWQEIGVLNSFPARLDDSDKEKLTLLKNKGFLEMKRCFDNSPGGMLYFLHEGLIYKIDCIYTRYPDQWETGNSTDIVVEFLNGTLQGKKAYLDLYAFPQSKPLKPQGESFSIKVESKLLR